MATLSVSYNTFIDAQSTFNKLQDVQVTVTAVPIAKAVNVLNLNYVTKITIVDTFENVDFSILSASAILTISITPSFTVTADQLLEYNTVLQRVTTPIVLKDSAAKVASVYNFVQTNFPLISISANAAYRVPSPGLILDASTESSLTFSFTAETDLVTEYDSYTPLLTCTTRSLVSSNSIIGLDAGTAYAFILTYTGTSGLVMTTAALTFTTRLKLEQQIGDLTFNYYNPSTLLSLKDVSGNDYPIMPTATGFSYSMLNNSFVGFTKSFSLFDAGSPVCSFTDLTITAFNVPEPIFYFTNINHQTLRVVFDVAQSALNDSYTLRLTDQASGIVLFSNLDSSTTVVDLGGYAAGQSITIIAETVGSAGLIKNFVLSQFTKSVDSLVISQTREILSFSWSGRLLNAVVTLNGKDVASGASSPIQYIMPDNALVGTTTLFYLKGSPEIGDTQYSSSNISVSFQSFIALKFQIPSPEYDITHDASGISVFIKPQESLLFDDFTYTIEYSDGLRYSEISDTTTPFLLGNPPSFTVSTIRATGEESTSRAFIYYNISAVPATIISDKVFIIDTSTAILNGLESLDPTKISQIISTSGTIALNISSATRYASIISSSISVADSSAAIRASLNMIASLRNCVNVFPQTPMQISTTEFQVCKTMAGLFSPPLTIVDTAASIAATFSLLDQVVEVVSTTGVVKLTVSTFLSNPTAPVASIEINDSGENIASSILLLEAYPSITHFSSFDNVPFDVPLPSFVISATSNTGVELTISIPSEQRTFDVYGFIIFDPITSFVYKTSSVAGAIHIAGLQADHTYIVAVKTLGALGAVRQAESQTFVAKDVLIVNICFPKDTMVTCDQGTLAIQTLTAHNTFNGHAVQAITETVTRDDHLILFHKNSFSQNIPCADLRMSKDHAVLWNGKLQKAKTLSQGLKIRYTGEILYNVLLKVHGLMNVQGVACETLHPLNSVAKFYRGEGMKEISEWNDYVTKSKIFI